MDYLTIIKEFGFSAICIFGLGWYVNQQNQQNRSDMSQYREEAKAREEKLMKINEDRELRFIDTINNLTTNVSDRMNNIENNVKLIKEILEDEQK